MQATISEVRQFSERWIAAIDRTIRDAIGDGTPPELFEAMRYSALGPGKRMRPLLAIASCQVAGGKGEAALPMAAALEMVHAFSLVHDDLPCMDDDDMRRGRPTVHRAFSEPVALLAGDALMARSCGYLAASGEPWAASAVAELAASVSDGMVPGQVLDMLWEGKPDQADLDLLHTLKTGRLIVAACKMGGLAARAPEPVLEALGDYGAHVGLAFQIADDILDAVEPSGSDAIKNKATYPGRFGLERARQQADREIDQALAALERIGSSGASTEAVSVMKAIARYAVERDH